jgi:hypothetical protein
LAFLIAFSLAEGDPLDLRGEIFLLGGDFFDGGGVRVDAVLDYAELG